MLRICDLMATHKNGQARGPMGSHGVPAMPGSRTTFSVASLPLNWSSDLGPWCAGSRFWPLGPAWDGVGVQVDTWTWELGETLRYRRYRCFFFACGGSNHQPDGNCPRLVLSSSFFSWRLFQSARELGGVNWSMDAFPQNTTWVGQNSVETTYALGFLPRQHFWS